MRNELLQLSERVDSQKVCFKVVELKIISPNLIFEQNDHADQPIFKKSSLKYDKYELAKIISFDQLQLLFRPFKNKTTFKKVIRCQQIMRMFPILLLLILIAQFIFIRPGASNVVIIIWSIAASVVFTIFFLILLIYQRLKNKAVDQFQAYCITLSQQQNDVQIKFMRQQIQKGCMKYIFPQITYLLVKSKTIAEDERTTKLYTNQGLSLLSFSQDKPIFTQKSFRYNQNRLAKIISFQEFELLFRPFKSNDAFQKTVFWSRVLVFLIPTVFFSLIPLLFKKQGENDIYLLVISLGTLFLIFMSFILIALRLKKLHIQLTADYIEYCQAISRQQQKIEVVVHLKESNIPQSGKQIYSLQIKSKMC